MSNHPERLSAGADAAPSHVRDEEHFDRLLAKNDRVLVDFYANWCGPCQLMESTIDELATESEATVVKVDVEELPQLATRYDVQAIPTFLAFKDGSPLERLTGMQNKARIEAALNS